MVLKTIHDFFSQNINQPAAPNTELAVAALLTEVMMADGEIDQEELTKLSAFITQFLKISASEVKEIISEFGIKTSAEDPIPAKLLQPSLDIVAPVFTELINKSLREGSMEGVKESVIDPLLKKSGLDSEVNKHYRPVNNLVFFSKLIERVAGKQLDEHMTLNGR